MCAGVFVRAAPHHTHICTLYPHLAFMNKISMIITFFLYFFNKTRWHKTMNSKKRMRSQLPSIVCMHVTLLLSLSLSLCVCVGVIVGGKQKNHQRYKLSKLFPLTSNSTGKSSPNRSGWSYVCALHRKNELLLLEKYK